MNGIMDTRLLGLISALWLLTVETNAPFWPISASRDGQKAVLCRRSVMTAYAQLLTHTKGGQSTPTAR